jgi:heme exporter protein D
MSFYAFFIRRPVFATVISLIVLLVGLVSEQISTLRYGGRFDDRSEEPRA